MLFRSLDGDGRPEAVGGSGGYLLHAFNSDGVEPAGFPKNTMGWIASSPTLGDLDGDGKSDIIWRKTNGELATWLMNGFTLVGAPYYGTVSTDWVIAGSGDFDGDGRSDILWRNISGAVGYWAMNGAAILSMPILGSAP